MKKKFLIPSIFLSLCLSSCGYALGEWYDGVPYNSTVYEENYYRVWDERIAPGTEFVSETTRVLNKDNDLIFESHKDNTFLRLEPNVVTYNHSSEENPNKLAYDSLKTDTNGYGFNRKLSLQNPSLKYGVKSKLFDGQLFCNAGFEKVRTQTAEEGFGMVFSKEIYELPSINGEAAYFAVNLKGSVDHTTGYRVPEHTQTINIKVSFYCKNDTGFDKTTYTHQMDIKSNIAEDHEKYTLFGFRLNPNELKRIQGFSIEYDLISINNSEVASKDLQHSLLIYEVLMPNTIWR